MTVGKITQLFGGAALIAAVSLGLALPASAAGLVDPLGREAYKLSPEDWELLKQSVRQVLEAQQTDATASWQGQESGRAGRATLLRVFERDGRPCGEVEHVFTTGGGNRYVLPFCRADDGTWKVAF